MTGKTPDDVRKAFDTGSIVDATKEELEQYLLANGRSRIQNPINQARASEMGETMRQLLAARQSQQMHSQALNIAKAALIISIVALFFTAFPIISSLIEGAQSTHLSNESEQQEKQ